MNQPGDSFTLQVYGPGFPSSGQRMQARFSNDALQLDGPPLQHVPASAINSAAGGFEHTTLNLHWRDNGERWGATPVTAADQQCLLQTAPATLQPQLARYRRQTFRFSFGLKLVATLALLLVAGIGLFVWRYDAVVAWTAWQVSPEVETRIGERTLKHLKSEYDLQQTGPAWEIVQQLGQRLTADSAYQYRWYVANDETANAFALPGGIIVVHSGLLARAESAEEVAGVLAHEVEHVEQRHVLQNMIHTAGWAGLLALTLGDTSALASLFVLQAGSSYFGRGLETAADVDGVRRLHEAGIDPNGLQLFFKRLTEEHGDSALVFLSSHPSNAQRIAELDALVDALPPREYAPLEVGWTTFKPPLPDESKAANPEE